MKRIIASASLVAVGVVGLHGAHAPGLSRTQTTKFWNVSASLRGFYDDNYLAHPSSSPGKRDTFGFEVSPSVAVNFPKDQTYLGASYTYRAKYYEDRAEDEFDHTHEFVFNLDHRFSQTHNIEIYDSFVFTDEPEILDANQPLITRRTDSSAIRNTAYVDYNRTLTERLALALGYANFYYNYDDEGDFSRSALLDRMEHRISADGRYMARENLIGVAGFAYGATRYSSDDLLFPGGTETSEDRDSDSYTFSVGADAQLSQRLTGSFRVGVQYTEYDDDSSTSPYVDISSTYSYKADSFIRGGLRHFRNATDEAGGPGDVTLDQESTSLYAEVNHKFTPQVGGKVLLQYQNSEFNDGPLDGDADNYFLAHVGLNYEINQFLSTELGYNFNRLDSDVSNRSFTRNVVYVGIRASY